jgi:hypothetical protein
MAKRKESSKNIDEFKVGQQVFISDQYYEDHDISFVDVPRFGWNIKAIDGNTFYLERQRHDLKVFMFSTVEKKYIKKFVQ